MRDPAELGAELQRQRIKRLRADRARALGNVRAWQRQLQSGPRTELITEALRDGLAELKRLEAELKREGG